MGQFHPIFTFSFIRQSVSLISYVCYGRAFQKKFLYFSNAVIQLGIGLRTFAHLFLKLSWRTLQKLNLLFSTWILSFPSCLVQVWLIIFSNILLRKTRAPPTGAGSSTFSEIYMLDRSRTRFHDKNLQKSSATFSLHSFESFW
jgi:hypothetical protein